MIFLTNIAQNEIMNHEKMSKPSTSHVVKTPAAFAFNRCVNGWIDGYLQNYVTCLRSFWKEKGIK